MSALRGGRPGIGQRRILSALLRQRRRLALATVAVALSVGYIAGALTLLDRVSEGLDDLAAAGAERADLIVEGDIAYESALEQTRRLVPGSVAPVVAEVEGVAAAIPRIEEVAILLAADGEPVVTPGLSEQPLGTNWPDDEELSPYRFVGEGRPPEGPDEVVIDERSAREAAVEVGDTLRVVGVSAEPFEVVGIVTTEAGPLPAGSSLALFDTETTRELFDVPDNDNRVAVRLEPGADAERVAAEIAALLPAGAQVVDGATGAEHRQEGLTRGFTLIRWLIIGFAALALVVGMVTVANSLTLLYAQRRRTFAGFRLLGARRRQLVGAALVEAALLAALASLIGAPLGVVLGRLIEGALGNLGTAVPVAGPVVSLSALGWAALIGVGATVFAAVVPAVRACRVPPVEAVAEVAADAGESFAVRLLNTTLMAGGAAALLAGLLVLADVSIAIALGIAIAVVIVWLVVRLLPWGLAVAVAGGIRLVPGGAPALRRIGARDAVRNRSRTAATTGALLLATAVVAGLAAFLSSFAASIDGDVGRLVRADLVVDSETFTRGGLPEALLEDLAEAPEVDAVSGWQVGRGWIAARPVRMSGIDGAVLDEVLSPGWVGSAPDALGPGGVLIERGVAEELGITAGATVPVEFTSLGVVQLVVEGIYDSGSVLLGDVVLDRSVLIDQVPLSFDIAALVTLSGGGEAGAEGRAAVEELAAEYGVTAVLDPVDFVDARGELLRGFERVVQWMLLFTLLQALVGVVNTLLLSVGERRREFGLLRAAGATRRQLHRLVLAEGVSFATVGTVLGIVAGVGLAGASIAALGRFGISGLQVPIPVLVLTAVAAIGLGVSAAVLPARAASAVAPLAALADTGDRPATRMRPSAVAPIGAPGPAPTTGPVLPPPFVAPVGAGGVHPRIASPEPNAPPAPPPAPDGMPAGAPAPRFAPAATRPTTPPPVPGPPVPPEPTPPLAPAAAAVPPDPPASAPPVAPTPESPDHPHVTSPPARAPAPGHAPPVEVSPFVGPAQRVASAPTSDPSPPAIETQPTHDAPPAVAARAGAGAGSPDRPDAHPAAESPPATEPLSWVRPGTDAGSVPPPRPNAVFGRAPGREHRPRASADRTAATPGDPAPPPARLADLLARLDERSQVDAVRASAAFAAALAADEVLEAVVHGWVGPLSCLLGRTNTRLVLVVDRFPEPLVESLVTGSTSVSLFGPPGTDHVSIAVVDGRRLLEVTGVVDVVAARVLAAGAPTAAPRARRSRSQYF